MAVSRPLTADLCTEALRGLSAAFTRCSHQPPTTVKTVINPATDCKQALGPSDWRAMNRMQLEFFATYGNQQQKDSLIDWGYSGLPAFFFEELFFLATGQEWLEA